jgi:hypothetical protein
VSADDLPKIPDFEQLLASTKPAATATPDDDFTAASFAPVDLGPVIEGQYEQPEPLILMRDDRRGLFYVGEVNGIHGPSGEGKSFVTLAAAVDEIRRGHRVVLIDLEDNAPSIVARLRLLGANDQQIAGAITYVRPSEPFGLIAIERLVEIVGDVEPRLVVIDSLGEAFGLDGIDENSDAEVGPWLRRVARRLADLGPGVILVDHSTKANDNPLYPSGSKRKRAAIGGASYLVSATDPLVAGTGGRLSITCAKDRHGAYARGERVGDWVMSTEPGVGTRWTLYAPGPAAAANLPVILAARSAADACKAEGGELSQRVLLEMMTIKASTDVKRAGIDLAVARGALQETAGARRARMFTYQSDLPEEPSE